MIAIFDNKYILELDNMDNATDGLVQVIKQFGGDICGILLNSGHKILGILYKDEFLISPIEAFNIDEKYFLYIPEYDVIRNINSLDRGMILEDTGEGRFIPYICKTARQPIEIS